MAVSVWMDYSKDVKWLPCTQLPVIQEALLMPRNHGSTLSVEIVLYAAQMFDGLHLKRPVTGE